MHTADLHAFVTALRGRPHATRRRDLMRAALGLAGGSLLAALPLRHAAGQASPARFTAYPFSLGVASGAPRESSVVLWTRLAPEPLAVDGLGGMTPDRITVAWEVAEDEQFSRIVRKGAQRAVPELAHSVHVEVAGLAPGRWYYYRFIAGGEASPVGRTRTAAPDMAKMKFAFASCQQYEQGFFSAYRHMAREDLDLVAFLGDYIYEANWGSNLVRRHAGAETETLAQYRQRHAQYKTDADLQRMHAAAPWIVTWDDHEVDNDYAADVSEHLDPRLLQRRAAAYQAYYEHLPLPVSALPKGPDMRIYDRYAFGRLAAFHVLDDRQYRTPHGCPRPGMRAGSAFLATCEARTAPGRTLLGAAQEAWLRDGLAQSTATWNVLAQQTLMAKLDNQPGPGEVLWTDGWDGYPAARQELLSFMAEKGVGNPLVIGGDVHTHHVANLTLDFDDPAARVVATEFCGTSISSEGNPQDKLDAMLPDNPHMLLADSRRRGYVVMTLTPSRADAELRVIDSEKKRDPALSTLARYAVEAGRPGARRL